VIDGERKSDGDSWDGFFMEKLKSVGLWIRYSLLRGSVLLFLYWYFFFLYWYLIIRIVRLSKKQTKGERVRMYACNRVKGMDGWMDGWWMEKIKEEKTKQILLQWCFKQSESILFIYLLIYYSIEKREKAWWLLFILLHWGTLERGKRGHGGSNYYFFFDRLLKLSRVFWTLHPRFTRD
jgi:hypothetical protein